MNAGHTATVGPLLSHCMVGSKSARRCFSRFFVNFNVSLEEFDRLR